MEAPCARRDQTERHLFLRVQCREIAGIDGEREQLESVGSGLFEKHPIQNVRVDVGVELVHGREVGHGVRIAGQARDRKAHRSPEAMTYHRRALAIRQRLGRENPTDVIAQNDVARTYGNMANLLRNRGEATAAAAALDSAAAIGEALVALPLDTTSTVTDFTRRSNPWENIREDLALIHQ